MLKQFKNLTKGRKSEIRPFAADGNLSGGTITQLNTTPLCPAKNYMPKLV